MRRMWRTLAACCALLVPSFAQSEEAVATGFVDRQVELDGEVHRYQVFVPEAYEAGRPWPLIVFLNGRGECGRDGRRQATVGLGKAIRRQPERWPFVVVFPQKPVKRTQWGDHDDLVQATLAATEKQYAIDPARRFLTGLSQGGSGAWELGSKHAATFCAVAPVCGYRLGTWKVKGLVGTPVWAFHGEADKVVPMAQSQLLCGELRKAGGAPALTTYPGVGHNSWDDAYGGSALAEWFRLAAKEPLGARYLADHRDVETRAELRSGERTRSLTGDDAWRALQRLVRVGGLGLVPGDDAEDVQASLQLTARGAGGEWRCDVRLGDGAAAAAARQAIAAIVAAADK